MRLPILMLALAIAFLSPTGSEAQYQLGSRGGCYTLSKSGQKQYVDRSLCAPNRGKGAETRDPRANTIVARVAAATS